MRVIIDRNTFVRGVLFKAAPDIVTVDDVDAKALIALGKARLAPGEPAQAEPGDKPEPPLPEQMPDLKSMPYPLRQKLGKGKGKGKKP